MKDRKKRYHLMLTEQDMQAIMTLACMAGCSRNEWIRRALRDAVREASVSMLARPQNEAA